MAMLHWIGLAYLDGALLMGLFQAWRMLFRLDAFDWQYERQDVWVDAILATLLWPLVIVAKDRGKHAPQRFSIAARMRELDRLDENPPLCGEIVEYTTSPLDSSAVRAVFRFPAAQLRQAMLPTLQRNPHHWKDERGSIFRWLSSHNAKVVSPTPVPEVWNFTQVVADGLEAGLGDAECSLCGQRFGAVELTRHRVGPSRSGGWVLDFWRCPAGHDLLQVEAMHLSYARPCDDSNQRPRQRVARSSKVAPRPGRYV